MTQRKPLPPGFELSVNGVRYIIEDCIAAGGHSFIYEVRAFSGLGSRKTVLKEYFPAKGAERNAEGIVCPKDITAEKFLSRRQELQQEAEAGGLAGNKSYQVISLTDFDEQGYAVMPKHSADAVPLATLLAGWDENGVPSTDPFYADLGRARYALKIAASILAGLNTIHSQAGLIHCDLSLKNVLWAGSDQLTGENCTALFLDFGSAQKLENGIKLINSREDLPPSTAYITAPELHSFPTVLSFATDIFAVGSLLAALIIGTSYLDKADTVRAFGFTALDRCKLPNRFKQELKILLNTALAENPQERFTDAAAMLKKVQELLRLSAPKEYALTCRAAAPVENFIGRTTQKKRLSELLQAGKNPIFITGNGGMGKTELALEFALDNHNEYDFFCTYFKNDLTETVLALDFSNLQKTEEETAKTISEKNINKTPEEIDALIRQARYELRLECLSQYADETVLIIDNFDPADFNAIRSSKAYKDLTALPLRIIFTTRRQIENAAVVNVAELAEEDLLQLIKSYYTTRGKDDVLLDLIREVEGHTLTVDIIGRTLKQGEKWGSPTPLTLLNLLRSHDYDNEQLKQVESDYDRSKPDAADNYTPRRILGHLQKVFRVSELKPGAQLVLSCACLLPVSGLNAFFFLDALGGLQQDVETLDLCGWLNVKNGTVSMHPLIKEVCMHEATKPNWATTHRFSEQLALKWDEQQQKTVLDATTLEQLLLTLQAALNVPTNNPMGKPADHGIILLQVCGGIAQSLGRYAECLKYMQQCLRILRQLKKPSATTFYTVLIRCAGCHVILGEPEQALAALTDALNIQRQVLPPNHAEIISTLSSLSFVHQMLGNTAKSQAFLEEATQLGNTGASTEQDSKEQQINEFRRLLQLGNAHMVAEENDKAIEYLEQALQNIPPSLNPDHPDIASLVSALGTAYTSKGDFASAEACLKTALENQRKNLVPGHPQLLATMMMLVNFYSETDQTAEALALQREILDIMRQNPNVLFGVKITDMLQMAAYNCQDIGLYAEALDYLAEAEPILRSNNPQDPEIISIMLTAASIFLDDNYPEGAKIMYEQAINRMQKAEDTNQNVLAQAMYNLAVSYNRLDRDGEALIWFGRALGVYRLNPDADPLDTADTMAAIGRTMLRMNNAEDARDYFEQALDIYQAVLPKDAPEIVDIQEKLLFMEPESDLPLQ